MVLAESDSGGDVEPVGQNLAKAQEWMSRVLVEFTERLPGCDLGEDAEGVKIGEPGQLVSAAAGRM